MTASEYEELDVTYDSGSSLKSLDRVALEAALGIQGKIKFLKTYSPPGARRMLDIGCGMGGYMRAGEILGLDVVGYEPSREHSEIARSIFGFDVRSNYFCGTDEKFDLIVLSHVIEHIHDPAAFLNTIVKSLTPVGRLVVVTPNADSLSARVTGSRWPMLVPEDHVTLLTRTALTLLLPAGLAGTTKTSEYRNEFLMTLGASLKARRKTISGGVSEFAGKRSWRSRVVHVGLTLGSLPFYAAASMTDRRGALIGLIDRPR